MEEKFFSRNPECVSRSTGELRANKIAAHKELQCSQMHKNVRNRRFQHGTQNQNRLHKRLFMDEKRVYMLIGILRPSGCRSVIFYISCVIFTLFGFWHKVALNGRDDKWSINLSDKYFKQLSWNEIIFTSRPVVLILRSLTQEYEADITLPSAAH